MLEDEPLPAFKPVLEALLLDKEVDKQRAAAELTAGVIGGKSQCIYSLSSQVMYREL